MASRRTGDELDERSRSWGGPMTSERASRFVAVVYLLAALVAAPSPVAAASPAVAPVAITPPRPLEPLHADYPQGASTEHDVLLEIVVGADGRVEDVRVLEG